MSECASKSCGCESPASDINNPAQTIPGGISTILAIAKMDCPTEERLIRNKLGGMPGIGELDFNLMKRTLTVTHAPDALEPAITAIRSLGMDYKRAATLKSPNLIKHPGGRSPFQVSQRP